MKIKKQWKDPMVIILVILLVFLTIGTAISGMHGSKIIIALDAAYGGEETGYQGIINESDFAESVVEKLATLLNEDSHFEVLLTHESGTTSSLEERINKINQNQPDIVLRIQASGTPDTSRSGQEIYADIPSSTSHDQSLKLAQCIAESFTSSSWNPTVDYLYYQPFDDDSYQLEIIDSTDTTDYQLETWELMEKCNVPVVISDQIYVTNQSDIDLWASEASYQKAAENYYSAIKKYYGIEK